MPSNERILVVEDDPDGQEGVSTMLEHLNIAIDVAYDAEQAENLLFSAAQHYKAVIIDLALPGKDGWEFLSEIQNNPETNHIPCIAVTAYHTSKTREEALTAGFSGYFAKPIDATTFSRELESFL